LNSLGVTGSGTFSVDGLDQDAVADLQAGLEEGRDELAELAASTATSVGLFGTREEMAGKYDSRNLGAQKGIFGLPSSEAWYGGWLRDAAGNPPTGDHR